MEPVKFTFDKSFDAGASNRHEEEMSNLREQADADKQSAHQAGFQEGHAQALSEIESATQAVMEQLHQTTVGLFNEFHTIQNQVSAESAQIAHMVGLQLAENLIKKAPITEIEKLLMGIFDDLRDQPRLIIRVNNDVADAINDRIKELQSRADFEGEIVLAADPAFNPQDIAVEWADGGIKRDFEAIQQTINDKVANFVTGLVGEQEQAS
ncbi:FliH/SctL family protein [Temperatibacter marinus]|uniref:FliH/SctL family protein n=1 Tax=Temperatibacter marinus TaxID=1456591 RepID=A0AA52H9B5_9PROT|nr:FliH/SctL family protein [Temperatibacter marinus]WND02739.1 FliH/SctL family protein [Temperatibacter marinus]